MTATRKPRFTRRRVIVGAVLLVIGILAAFLFVREFTGWQSVTVELDLESSVQISRKPSHPFLAEYQRKVAVSRFGRNLSALSYPSDTGGGFPMQVRFYGDATRRVVRITDSLYDRLIDLRTGQFVPDETPPDGKDLSSAVRDAALPPLVRSVEIGPDMRMFP